VLKLTEGPWNKLKIGFGPDREPQFRNRAKKGRGIFMTPRKKLSYKKYPVPANKHNLIMLLYSQNYISK
jgi:hypothetical protein